MTEEEQLILAEVQKERPQEFYCDNCEFYPIVPVHGHLSAPSATTKPNVAKEWHWMSKIGIFSGTFDPVHGGHIAFALEAIQSAKVDKVYFLPEPVPRRKDSVTHYAHRVAMLRLALKPYPKLNLLELPDSQFSVSKSLPRLQKIFKEDELFMLIGSDMLQLLASPYAKEQWPDYERLVTNMKLIVGIRSGLNERIAKEAMAKVQPKGILIKTERAHASSREIRRALMKGQEHHELLASLKSYIAKHWIYVSLEVASANNS